MTNMYPANDSREMWNVSMYQYNTFEMNKEIYDKYGEIVKIHLNYRNKNLSLFTEFNHIVSSSSGKILTQLKNSGDVLWHKKDMNSPVVALFLMGRNGFLNIPFTSVDDNVFEKLLEPMNYEKLRDIELV